MYCIVYLYTDMSRGQSCLCLWAGGRRVKRKLRWVLCDLAQWSVGLLAAYARSCRFSMQPEHPGLQMLAAGASMVVITGAVSGLVVAGQIQ